MKSWLQDNDVEIYSIRKGGKTIFQKDILEP